MSEAAAAAFLGVERSIGGRRWERRGGDDRLGLALSQRLGLPEIVGRLIAQRDITLEEAEAFLAPTLRAHLPDPSHLLDMDAAAARLADAVEREEGIAIFGDYDVDGATSTALLTRFLRALGREPAIYIPDRSREGYGPNAAALLGLKARGAGLVVTVDCGATAHEPLAAAAEAGLDVVVCDHHAGEPRMPPCAALVNPNRFDETSPHRQLAAVGVAFLLVVATNRELRRRGFFATRPAPDLMSWLDLVALGTVADVVSLTGVNRALVRQGLAVLRGRANVGLAALADVAGLSEKPEAWHLGYILGPRVNAGGRVGRSDLGTRLLATDDPAEARALAEELNRLNEERRAIEAEVLIEAIAMAEARDAASPIVFVAGEGWHPGVIGIVAARLKERYDRPALVVAIGEDGTAKGSGRSVPGIALGEAVIAARQAGLALNGGGHAMAAGFTAAAGGLPALEAFLAERVARDLPAERAMPRLGLDGTLECAGATPDFLEQVGRIGPFGQGNSEPRFAIRQARLVKADQVGSAHVRVILTGPCGGRLKSIAFRSLETEIGPALLTGRDRAWHVAGHLRTDSWQGREGTQLVIDDIAEAR